MVKPPHIPESGPLKRYAEAINRVSDFAASMQILRGKSYRVRKTTSGQLLDFEKAKETQTVEPGNVKMVQVVANFGNYVTAYEYDANSETTSGALLQVAKPWRLRRTGWDGEVNTFTFNGASYSLTYTYSATDYRTALDPATNTTERQAVIPVYKAGDILFVTEPENGTGVFEDDGTGTTSELTWLDLNVDARAWCRY